MKKYVYLAGPILGCNEEEANDWRRDFCDHLQEGVVGISPLRCEPLHGERYTMEYKDPRFGVPRAIAAKNMHDVQNCDIVLAFLPTPPPGRHQSFGTLIEMAWARAFGKQVILVTDDPEIRNHAVVDSCCNWVLDTLYEAADVCNGILGGYTGGKNV